MSTLTKTDVEHVFESLRKGLVPERGIDAFAVGIEKQRGEIHRQLDSARSGEGTIKFLRGGYGCGKTFMARLACSTRRRRGSRPASSWSPTTTSSFHRFDDVYRKVLTELGHRVVPARSPRRHPRPLDRHAWRRASSRRGGRRGPRLRRQGAPAPRRRPRRADRRAGPQCQGDEVVHGVADLLW